MELGIIVVYKIIFLTGQQQEGVGAAGGAGAAGNL